jgi:penicillin amidase
MRTLLVAALAVTAMGVALGSRQAPSPARSPTAVSLRGLEQPVGIRRDRWGINHIEAKTERDLFFAQGYAAARDRLFQFELWRRQATGTLAEVLGPREVARDRAARLFAFRGDLGAELRWYHPRGDAIVRAFVAGINAYVDEVSAAPSRLPPGLRLLGWTPGRWTPEVVVSRHAGLLGNLTLELSTARAVQAIGVRAVKEIAVYEGGDPLLDLDPAIAGASFAEDVIAPYRAWRAAVTFAGTDLVGAPPSQPEAAGSNNWVIAGARTASGRPILANDPHRVVTVPSLRYWVHLKGPGWNVIGGGEPVLPGVSIGHNETGAWGLTIFGNDVEDLYVYRLNPADPLEYWYGGRWEKMRVVRDRVAVRGAAPVGIELHYTRHGPVLHEDTARHVAYALRAGWLERGGAPYLASLRMNQAQTWEQFRDACTFNHMPAENMVWADVHGRIGWQAAGIQPRRRTWSGLVPVPGDGRYEWDGFLPIADLPHRVDPGEGFIATANHYLFPDGYPHHDALHYTWADRFRAQRIDELLRTASGHTVADSERVQHDELSIPARRIVPLLRPLRVDAPVAAAARDLLVQWDGVMARESVAAGVYAMLQRRLLDLLRDRFVPNAVRDDLTLSVTRMLDWLEHPGRRFGAAAVAERDRLLVRALEESAAALTTKLGPEMKAWHWGQPGYHRVRLRHTLSALLSPALAAGFDAGPLPRGGDAHTVNVTSSTDDQTNGASFRLIADTADWDRSVGTNTPGQSGDPASPHYRDLFEPWANGRYFPVAFSPAMVESVTRDRTTLVPARVR